MPRANEFHTYRLVWPAVCKFRSRSASSMTGHGHRAFTTLPLAAGLRNMFYITSAVTSAVKHAASCLLRAGSSGSNRSRCPLHAAAAAQIHLAAQWTPFAAGSTHRMRRLYLYEVDRFRVCLLLLVTRAAVAARTMLALAIAFPCASHLDTSMILPAMALAAGRCSYSSKIRASTRQSKTALKRLQHEHQWTSLQFFISAYF